MRGSPAAAAALQLREGLSFIQIITNVQEIYQLRFRLKFLQFTEALAGLISFTLPFPNLDCMVCQDRDSAPCHLKKLWVFCWGPIAFSVCIIAFNILLAIVRELRRKVRHSLHQRSDGARWRGRGEKDGLEPKAEANVSSNGGRHSQESSLRGFQRALVQRKEQRWGRSASFGSQLREMGF